MDFKRGRVNAQNLVGSLWQAASSGESLEVTSPWTGQLIGSVALSGAADVAQVIAAAREPAREWAKTPLKDSAARKTPSLVKAT